VNTRLDSEQLEVSSPRRLATSWWKVVVCTGVGVALVACSGGSSDNIAGQVSGPNGSNLNGTSIAALLCNNNCQTESDLTQTVGGRASITATGSSSAYQMANVPAGKYIVLAVQDTNGDRQIGTGDLVGTTSSVVTPPATNANIQLQPFTANAASKWTNLESLWFKTRGPR
jgi:TPP-dependent trihydroxycyclohexane-1,2-dione (THcHDO) dehydratase